MYNSFLKGRSGCFLLLLLFSLVCLLPSASAAAVRSVPEQARKVIGLTSYDGLISAVRQRGDVKVIVRVDVPLQQLSATSRRTALADVAAISRGQSSVAQAIAGRGVRHAHNFTYVPYMALTVDEVGLKALLASDAVLSVEEDIPVPPALNLSLPRVGATAIHHSGYDGSGVAIAILDTGIDGTHPFLAGSIVSEACYSTANAVRGVVPLCPGGVTASVEAGSAAPYGGSCPEYACDHGTHVAGIAAGSAGISGSPGPGVAPGASIIAIQVFSRFDDDVYCGGAGSAPCVLAYYSDFMKGLERVYTLREAFNIAAVNVSIGGRRHYGYCDDHVLKPAIDNLRAAGIATVISSGNDGYADSLAEPACISSAISVGGTTDADAVALYSNSAHFLSLLAPGSSIKSSVPGNSYQNMTGTSMAAPHVTGAWALMKQARPGTSAAVMQNAFTSTGLSLTDPRNGITKKRINVNEAINSLFTVTVAGDGVNGGTITADGMINAAWDGTALTGDARETVNAGSGPYMITATASSNVQVDWTGDCTSTTGNGTGTAICSIHAPVSKDMTLTATFRVSDADRDGMADVWEIQHFGDLSRNGLGDLDGDGMSDRQEYVDSSDPVSCLWQEVDPMHLQICVNHPLVLKRCLAEAETDNRHNTVLLVKGVYKGNFDYHSVQDYDLDLYGGYAAGCLSKASSSSTVLDGSAGSAAVLNLDASAGTGSISVADLRVINGHNVSDKGGGIRILTGGGRITLVNNIVTGNQAVSGGGIGAYAESGDISLINNTVAHNHTLSDNGGGIEVSLAGDSAIATIANNIIWGNSTASGICQDIFIDSDHDLNGLHGTVILKNNDFNRITGICSTGSPASIDPSNMDVDPLFVNTANGNYHLTVNSPVINKGDKAHAALLSTDIDGHARILGNSVDMGADEVTIPGAPTLISPTDIITTGSPIFTWTKVSGATSYRLRVTDSSNTIVRTETLTAAAVCKNGVCTSVAGTSLEAGENYSWTVRSINKAGYSPWAGAGRFSVILAAPTAKAGLKAPKGLMSNATMSFSWTVVDQATSYRLSIRDGGGVVYYKNYNASSICSNDLCSVSPAFILETAKNYSWTVRGINVYGTGPWAVPANFTITTAPE